MNQEQIIHAIRVALQNLGAKNRSQEAKLVESWMCRSAYYDWIAGKRDIHLGTALSLLRGLGLEVVLRVSPVSDDITAGAFE